MTLIVGVVVPGGIAISADSRACAIVALTHDPATGASAPRRIGETSEAVAGHMKVVASDSHHKLFIIRDRFVVASGGDAPVESFEAVLGAFARSAQSDARSVPEFIPELVQVFHDLPALTRVALLVAGVDESGDVSAHRALVQELRQNRLDCAADGQRIFGPIILGYKAVVERLLAGTRIAYERMLLQDAVDLSRHLVHTTIEQLRFELCEKTVGGAIDTAVVTPAGARFVTRRELVVREMGAPPALLGGDEADRHVER